MSSLNPCSVPRCRNTISYDGLCQAHLGRLDRYGDVLAHIPLGSRDLPSFRPRSSVGPFICICEVSRPNPKCCTTCGYPSVHRMAPAVRDRAIRKAPWLAAQIVVEPEYTRRLA